MLKDTKRNMLVINKKTENVRKEIKTIIKNKMEILSLEQKHTISEIKIY